MVVKRLFDYLYKQKEQRPLEKSLGQRVNGDWKFYSTQDLIDKSRQLASGLLKLGVKKGDIVSMAAYKNRPEWIIVDLATQQIGVVNAPLYPTISPSDYEYILNEAEVKVCFVGADDLYDKVNQAKANSPSLEHIICFDRQSGRPFWEDLFDDSRLDEVDSIAASVDTDDVATIIYTSGTTGNPKGVVLTHHNIVHVVDECDLLIPAEGGEPVLSFLPLCHIFERACAYAYLNKAVSVHFTGTDNLGGDTGDIKNVKPAFFTTVPRLLEKVYEKIYNKGLELTGVKKKLFFWALSLTDDYEYDQAAGGLKWKIADKLIFSKWREALGGNMKGIVTGAAPLPKKMAKVFSAAGIPIREGYGLTETSPVLTANSFAKGCACVGTVGTAIRDVDLYIDTEGDYRDGEGEILAAGPNIMVGYYKQPEKTAEVFTEINGKKYFRTGDVGTFVKGPGGKDFLKITDRKKELLKTSGGKYVAPAPIENAFREDFLVDQMMVIGDKQKFVSALIVPAEEALKDWCGANGVTWNGLDATIKEEKVLAAYQALIDKLNPQFAHIEQIKKFTLLSQPWEPTKADGSDAELTPTMKLKRRVIREKYANEIAALYA